MVHFFRYYEYVMTLTCTLDTRYLSKDLQKHICIYFSNIFHAYNIENIKYIDPSPHFYAVPCFTAHKAKIYGKHIISSTLVIWTIPPVTFFDKNTWSSWVSDLKSISLGLMDCKWYICYSCFKYWEKWPSWVRNIR